MDTVSRASLLNLSEGQSKTSELKRNLAIVDDAFSCLKGLDASECSIRKKS